MIRALAAVTTAVVLLVISSFVAVFATGCTEPGDCSAVGELGRSTAQPLFWVAAFWVAAVFVFGLVCLVTFCVSRRRGSR